MTHLMKNHWFIKTIATTKSSIKSLKMKFFHPFCFIMFKTYLYIVFCQKLRIGKNYLLSHFGQYLISACREIRLVLVRWVTYRCSDVYVLKPIVFWWSGACAEGPGIVGVRMEFSVDSLDGEVVSADIKVSDPDGAEKQARPCWLLSYFMWIIYKMRLNYKLCHDVKCQLHRKIYLSIYLWRSIYLSMKIYIYLWNLYTTSSR